MKNKYNDNKLAEELDLIVLTSENHRENGLPCGSLGTLTYSYTGEKNPLYAEFAFADGTRKEERLGLRDFRVLNERNEKDLSLIIAYLKKQKERSAFRADPPFHVCN
jgi:hypothetical protein